MLAFNLRLSRHLDSAGNLLNKVNLSTPVGNLSSQLFGSSTSIHGFGPGGASANRMVDLQMRFSF